MRKKLNVSASFTVLLLGSAVFAQKEHAMYTLGLLMALVLTAGAAWNPPIGIPHPGDWFLRTEGTVQTVTTGGGSRTFTGTGTAQSPVIFRGVNSPQFTGTVGITGSYVIVENIIVDGAALGISGDHIVVRGSEVKNYGAGGGNGTALLVNTGSTDIVIYNNRVHDNGAASSSTESDMHGIGGGGHRVWILDNEIYNNGGDGVQFGHDRRNAISDFYIGRNTIHNDRENAVDIKEASNVIISQNTMYGYRATSSSEGAAVVIHYCPVNSHVIYNTISNCDIGISCSSLLSRCSDVASIIRVRFIGNVIKNIAGNAIQGWGSGKVTDIVGNTIYNVGYTGMDVDNIAAGSLIENNILYRIQGAALSVTPSGNVTVRNNLLDTADPQFVDSASGDFRLRSTSPAKDAGIASGVYAAYQTLFGLSIAVDHQGISRPQGSLWDIGAFEYSVTSKVEGALNACGANLFYCSPNPFNPITQIHVPAFSKAGPQPQKTVSLKIYDALGRLEADLTPELLSGKTTIEWDASSVRNGKSGSGVYFCRFEVGQTVLTRPLFLTK